MKDLEQKTDSAGMTSGLSSPQLDEKTAKPTRRAINDFKQAHSIAKRLFDKANEDAGRLSKAAIISRKYGGESPYTAQALRATGQAWRNNYSTNPLASVVDRSKPQLTDPLKSSDTLTYSKLSSIHEDAEEKTRTFRERTTRLIREWPGYADLIDTIAGETYLYGNNVVVRLEDDWRPISFKFDESFLPEGSGQHASQLQVVCLLQPVLLHNFLSKLSDIEIAKSAGYNIEGCIKAANQAGGLRNTGDNTEMERADAIREGASIDGTYDGEIKVVWLYYTIVQEYDGGVNIWITERKEGHPIRSQENVAERMDHLAALFTLQNGNGKFYGSKGAGRLLTNLHIALDRSRNMASDQIYLSGLPILKADDKDIERVQAHVRHPFIVIPRTSEVEKEQVQFDWNAYEWLDSKLVSQMESIAGAFIPPKIQEGSAPNTKIEAAQKAERELAVRNGVLGRHMGQHGNLVTMMQRGIYSQENLKEGARIFKEMEVKRERGIRMIASKVWKWIEGLVDTKSIESAPATSTADKEAVEAIVDLLRAGLKIEEIAELALCPANNVGNEAGSIDKEHSTMFLQAKIGNPYYDQRALARIEATDNLGEDRAKLVLLQEREDPNDEAVAIRQQLIEWSEIVAGEEMPVASTDLHKVHKQVIVPRLAPIIETLTMAPSPELLPVAKLGFTHLFNHCAMDDRSTPEEKTADEQNLTAWKTVIEQAEKVIAKMMEESAQAGGAVPPPVNGQPMQAQGPDGSMMGAEEPYNPEKDKLMSDVVIKNQDQQLRARELDLKEREMEQRDEQFTMKLTTDAMQKVADKAAEARKAGMQSAEQDMRDELAGPQQ